MRWLAVLLLAGCGHRPAPRVDADWTEAAGRAEVGEGDPEDRPPPRASPPPPPGQAPKARAPLPDGWPRDPVEPLPLKGKKKTLMDTADPVARFVTDIQRPGKLTIELAAKKTTRFKARVVLYDSFGGVLAEAVLTKKGMKIGPKSVIPGTLYLLVERRGGVADLVVRGRFEGEKHAPH